MLGFFLGFTVDCQKKQIARMFYPSRLYGLSATENARNEMIADYPLFRVIYA
jgi:hypothetical protein